MITAAHNELAEREKANGKRYYDIYQEIMNV
jgi:cytidylate kinase